MTSSDAVNFQSLNVVRDELVATIEESARHLENFVTAQEDGESLQNCIDGVKQIVGILRLIQFKGACILAEELLATANEIMPGNEGRTFERRLEAVSSAFFVLTRYLEYVQQTEKKMPVLLIPHINDLRKSRGAPAFPESHFFNFPSNQANFQPPDLDPYDLAGETFQRVVRRIRHMYQVGLLGLIREKQIKHSLALMRRSVIRLNRLGGSDKELSNLWWLANVTLQVMNEEGMTITETRKFLFGRIDRIIRQVEEAGPSAYAATPPKGLIKELVYLIALSKSKQVDAVDIRKVFGVSVFSYTDKDLTRERESLNGPSAHTVSSLSKVLQTELTATKNVLENTEQADNRKIDDLPSFIGTLNKVAEILAIVGLVSPSNILKEEIKRIENWAALDAGPDANELNDVANTLLYLESTVASLEGAKLSDEKLNLANKVAQKEIIRSGQLAEAERIVIEEAEAGLSLSKRALGSFSDDSFDTGHIRNISKTLNSVRGGMIMLKRYRAASVLEKCVEFVDKVLMSKDPPPAMKELLETFADAIISVEYYLDSATGSMQMDESVLQIAEESLEALGYAVD